MFHSDRSILTKLFRGINYSWGNTKRYRMGKRGTLRLQANLKISLLNVRLVFKQLYIKTHMYAHSD